MEQGAVENMRCPEPSCRRPFQPYVIKELLGEAGYTKYVEGWLAMMLLCCSVLFSDVADNLMFVLR